MALKTTQEQLEEVQTAITAVLTNQSYRLGGRQVVRADLEALQARETYLKKQLAAERGTRPAVMAVRLGGMGY